LKKRYTRDTKLELISHNISIVDFEYKEGRMEERMEERKGQFTGFNEALIENITIQLF
jgi:hypothetical protein